jgi:hypothetical protein
VFRVVRLLFGVVVLVAIVWYVWALIPNTKGPPAAGTFFSKPAPLISALSSQLPKDALIRVPLSVATIQHACEPPRLLRPLQKNADHVVLHVTRGTTTLERNISCSTLAYVGPWRPSS